MDALRQPIFTKRYNIVTSEKAGGVTYTPKILADFVANKIISASKNVKNNGTVRILDPAIGHGELIMSILNAMPDRSRVNIEVYGFETDSDALLKASQRISASFPSITLHFEHDNFLQFVLENFDLSDNRDLFCRDVPDSFDIIIANPPYVRTQIMGSAQAQALAAQFGLTGRVDLYYAFILGISQVLKPHGIAGIIVSNRFMTTRSGASVRRALFDRFNIHYAWDLGDTKLFEAAVLPAVLLVEGRNGEKPDIPAFTSIYETNEPETRSAQDPIAALELEGVVKLADGRRFLVQHGKLNTSGTPDGVWRIASDNVDSWLAKVDAHTWSTFRDIGKIRVGVKTCADKVFIRNDWGDMPASERPELLRALTTHHIARRFKQILPERQSQILYPHEIVQGRRRPVDLTKFPRSQEYLETHRSTLEGRRYVIEAGREWYEIWVPQDPALWKRPKLVFRDIADEPTFWMDLDGSVVNGDCYWLTGDDEEDIELLWLAAAVGNSTFIERFYDLRFHNKLYAGRRRFITQYVEKFPLPEPSSGLAKAIIAAAKRMYECTPSPEADALQQELDGMVWESLTGGRPS